MTRHVEGGFFVTLEGGEGAGKSTQARLLAEALKERGYGVHLTREPGGTLAAEEIRRLLLFSEDSLSWRAEIMLLMAARCDHLDTMILPALAEGQIVICDRFHDSTLAYQGYGVGCGNPERLSFIEALRGLIRREPDLTLLLDLPWPLAVERMRRRREKDRYEEQDRAFHDRVSEGFDQAARRDPQRIRRMNADQPVSDVARSVLDAVEARVGGRTA